MVVKAGPLIAGMGVGEVLSLDVTIPQVVFHDAYGSANPDQG